MKYFFTFVAVFIAYHAITLATKPLVHFIVAQDLQASDISSCGVKPPPPVKCLFCDPICMCDDKGSCDWVFIKND
jgi:hypothetical protein